MIPRPRARPQTILQAIAKPSLSNRQQRRHKHNPPELPLQKAEVFQKYGVPGFLSAKAYDETFLKYTQHLCDQMNIWTQGTADEAKTAFRLHEDYSHQASHAALFNYASMAYHTHYFWETITDKKTRPGADTSSNVEENFDSLDHLRNEMLEAADAMFGNGFVWLMKNADTGILSLLCTYNAGSPWPEAHRRRQSHDMNNTDGRALLAERLASNRNQSLADRLTRPQNTVGSIGEHSASRVRNYSNHLNANPILGVCTWQHMYLTDYGINGKRAYLSAWWDHIDWDVVEQRHVRFPPLGSSRVRDRKYTSVLSASMRRSM